MDDTLLSIPNDKTDGIGSNTTDATTNYDIGLRSVASFVTAVLSLSLLFFLIHRLRQRKIRGIFVFQFVNCFFLRIIDKKLIIL